MKKKSPQLFAQAKSTKKIPFDFIFEELRDVHPTSKPMFGCYAIYVGEKIVFILRDREAHPDDNGVWLATTGEHHNSLREEFPEMRDLKLFGPGPTGWQNLPVDSDDFERSVLKACALVLARDPRIGKIPDRKKKARVRKVPNRLKKKRG